MPSTSRRPLASTVRGPTGWPARAIVRAPARILVRIACGLILLPTVTLAAAGSGDVAIDDSINDAVGKAVTIKLFSGREFADATLLSVGRDDSTGAAVRLRVRTSDGKSRVVGIKAVASLDLAGKSLDKSLDRAAHDRATNDGAAIDRRANQSEAEAAEPAKPQRRRRMSRLERIAAEKEAERQRWIAQVAARGVKPWEPLSPDDHNAALERQRERCVQARSMFPGLELVETEHFLFCTNLTPAEVGEYVAALDRMYAWMQHNYGVDPTRPVWRGKASIFAFRRSEEFVAFEQRFFRNQPQPGTAGLCHSNPQRDVVISAHLGSSVEYFGTVLVHETSHGFIHCYRTPVRVPSWVNEGMAEVIASKMVPQSKGVQQKEKQFVDSMLASPQPRLGKAFFSVRENIPFDRYGGATSMTRFLIETEASNYVAFVQLLKTGMPWEEALMHSYNANKQQLVSAYGQWIGVPHLMP